MATSPCVRCLRVGLTKTSQRPMRRHVASVMRPVLERNPPEGSRSPEWHSACQNWSRMRRRRLSRGAKSPWFAFAHPLSTRMVRSTVPGGTTRGRWLELNHPPCGACGLACRLSRPQPRLNLGAFRHCSSGPITRRISCPWNALNPNFCWEEHGHRRLTLYLSENVLSARLRQRVPNLPLTNASRAHDADRVIEFR